MKTNFVFKGLINRMEIVLYRNEVPNQNVYIDCESPSTTGHVYILVSVKRRFNALTNHSFVALPPPLSF
jgi:hypothetical protein